MQEVKFIFILFFSLLIRTGYLYYSLDAWPENN